MTDDGHSGRPGGTEPTADGGSTGRGQPDEDELWTHWVRWPDIDETQFTEYGNPLPRGDIHIHRVCRLLPSWSTKEGGGPDNFEFISGTPRWLLRHTPLVVLVVGMVFLVSAELSPEVQGISAILSVVSPENSVLLAAALLPVPVLVWLLSSAGILDARDLGKAVVVYGTGLLLVVGTGFSFLLVWAAEDPAALPDNIVFASGYLLTLFVGGHLLYEGMLKIEFLFANLGRRDIIKSESHVYEAFLEELNEALHRDFLRDDLAAVLPGRAGRWARALGERTVGVSTSHVFAVLVSLQFGVLWGVQDGPQNLDFAVTLAGNVVLNVLIVIAAFQFLVVIAYFNRLLRNEFVTEAGERVNLTSEPFHYDGRAGFGDFGRFAIQINIILIVAALYCVYRLYVQGGRVLGAEGMMGLGDVELLLWAFSYLVPVLGLALAAGAWVYYSYWAMHRKMERDREHFCLRYQGKAEDVEGEAPAVGDRMDSFESGPDWECVQNTPTWPVNNQRLVSMVSGTLSPVVLMLPSLL
jgi:hypothetical protein